MLIASMNRLIINRLGDGIFLASPEDAEKICRISVEVIYEFELRGGNREWSGGRDRGRGWT